jgi:ankyrin repeat protein
MAEKNSEGKRMRPNSDDDNEPFDFSTIKDINTLDCNQLKNMEECIKRLRETKEQTYAQLRQKMVNMMTHRESSEESIDDTEELEQILNQEPSLINLKDSLQNTPLHFAVSMYTEDGLKSVKLLLSRGADLNAKNKDESTPLHLVLVDDREIGLNSYTIEITKLLISHKADLNARDKDGFTPIYMLLNGYTSEFTLQLIQLLIDNGAKLNVRDDRNWTPLDDAVSYSSQHHTEDIVKLLLDNRADPNDEYDDLEKEDDELEKEDDELEKEKDEIEYDKPLHIAVGDSSSTFKTVKLLLDYGAKVNVLNQDKNTPLHLAVRHNIDTFKLLLDNGAFVNAKNKNGNTPLHIAVFHIQDYAVKDNIKLLLERGANMKIRNIGHSTAYDYCRTEECKNLFRSHLIPNNLGNNIKSLISDNISLDCNNLETVNNYVRSLRINMEDPIWVNASSQKKCWLANKLKYYKELEHPNSGRSDNRLEYVDKLYKTAVSQGKLNSLTDDPDLFTLSDIKPLQEKIQYWKQAKINQFGQGHRLCNCNK